MKIKRFKTLNEAMKFLWTIVKETGRKASIKSNKGVYEVWVLSNIQK